MDQKGTRKIYILILIAVVLIGLIAFGYFYWLPKEKEQTENTNAANVNAETTNVNSNINFNTNISGNITFGGKILFINEGDLWLSNMQGKDRVKLIDADTVQKAEFSADKKNIAYTLLEPTKETVTTSEGENTEIELSEVYDAKNNLYLADQLGANSFLVKEGVESWGWIPSTNLIWYETSSLKEIFSWGYYGDDNVWIYDIAQKSAKLLHDESKTSGNWDMGMLSPQWSPDGQKLLFTRLKRKNDQYLNQELTVINRLSSKVSELLAVPYVGGDRGGPPPIPSYFWNPESDAIYTAFTPVISDYTTDQKPNFNVEHKSGYFTALKVPINGSPITKLIPEAPAPLTNAESFPKVYFNNDFSKIVYQEYVNLDTEGLDVYKWTYQYEIESPLSLVIYDITNKTKKIISEDLYNSDPNYLNTYDGSSEIFMTDKYVYLFVPQKSDDKHNVIIKRFDLTTKTLEDFAVFPAITLDNIRSVISDIKYLPEYNTIYFRIGNQLLSLIDNKLGSILTDVTDVNYYLGQ